MSDSTALSAAQRAQQLLDLGRPVEALALCHQQLFSEPDSAPLLTVASMAARRIGRVADAVDLGRRAVAAAPSADVAHGVLATALLAAGQPREAADTAYRAVLLDPHNWVNHVRYSECLLALPNGHAHAWAAAQEGVRLAPGEAMAHRQIAVVALRAPHVPGNLEIAERAMRAALEIAPDDPVLQHDLAAVHFGSAKEGQGLAGVVGVLAVDPTGVGAEGLANARIVVFRGVFIDSVASVGAVLAFTMLTGKRLLWPDRPAASVVLVVLVTWMLVHWRRFLTGPVQRRLVGDILRRSRLMLLAVGCVVLATLAMGSLVVLTYADPRAALGAVALPASLAAGLSGWAWVRALLTPGRS